ncbi:MAG TPA: adenosine deaminase [Thermomicrobiales bacterium]|nr:adenosine deaminase [Thermomicrobiales bacterium]
MTNPTHRPVPEWLWALPKVELHVHLEGTIAPETLVELDRRHGHPQGLTSVASAAAWYHYTDFPGFIDTFTRISDQILHADDLGFVVERYGTDLARQGVRYAEVHYNAEPHLRRKGISLRAGLQSMNDARQRVLDVHGVEMRWIVDGVRDADIGPRSVDISIDWIVEAGPESGIVALGLGGNEIDRPAHKFAKSFQRAHDEGIKVVAHAGEAVGPASIRETLDYLDPARIGHGVTAAQDESLMAHLAARGIPLEISPTSNVRTGVVASYEAVPLRTFQEHGVRFSINSDDPPMFGTDLVSEYALAIDMLGMGRDQTVLFVADSIDQSFAPPDVKSKLMKELLGHPSEATL